MEGQALDMQFGMINKTATEKSIVIYQPSFLPWMGYFALFYKADIFVFYDDVQYTKRDWRNRNRIRTPQGWCWITVPVALEGRSYKELSIRDVKISNNNKWKYKHLKSYEHFYKKARYFEEVFNILEGVYKHNHKFLVEFLYELFFTIFDYLNLDYKKKVFFSSNLLIPKDLKKTDRLLFIIKEYFPDVKWYITGPTASHYLEVHKFNEMGLFVAWAKYDHLYYNQLMWGTNIFISHLSIVDLLFNHGKESLEILTHRKKIQQPKGIKIISANDIKFGKLEVIKR